MIPFAALSIVYIIFLLWIRRHWLGVTDRSTQPVTHHLTFSVLVPVRNEAGTIAVLLRNLKGQTFPEDQYEVIVIDDQSEDTTSEIVEQFITSNELSWKLIQVQETEQGGKKQALTRGVAAASCDYIITVDGDCEVQADFIKSYAAAYSTEDLVMISGPVAMKGDGVFMNLQSFEFSGLIAIGAATLHSGNPTMCNGANLSYKKEVFAQVGGYQDNEDIPSGDDEFLMQKVHKAYPDRVGFLKHQQAIVYTEAKDTLVQLLSQRIRWSSKWRFHKSLFIKCMAMTVFLNYVALLVALLSLDELESVFIFGTILVFRTLVLWYFYYPITQFFEIKGVLWKSLLIEIIYPFFVIFLGIASIFGKYSWKGRYYS